ncbi:MAG: hypothetical protein U9N50_02575, partial [Pseudomonadota bacterium]|nr:hypothetical protein [Pseudomonadota bacterium]
MLIVALGTINQASPSSVGRNELVGKKAIASASITARTMISSLHYQCAACNWYKRTRPGYPLHQAQEHTASDGDHYHDQNRDTQFQSEQLIQPPDTSIITMEEMPPDGKE